MRRNDDELNRNEPVGQNNVQPANIPVDNNINQNSENNGNPFNPFASAVSIVPNVNNQGINLPVANDRGNNGIMNPPQAGRYDFLFGGGNNNPANNVQSLPSASNNPVNSNNQNQQIQ